MEDYSIIYKSTGKTEGIKECIEIVKFYLNEWDGIYSALKELEDLLDKTRKEGRV